MRGIIHLLFAENFKFLPPFLSESEHYNFAQMTQFFLFTANPQNSTLNARQSKLKTEQ